MGYFSGVGLIEQLQRICVRGQEFVLSREVLEL